jgi:hypothetical protein
MRCASPKVCALFASKAPILWLMLHHGVFGKLTNEKKGFWSGLSQVECAMRFSVVFCFKFSF